MFPSLAPTSISLTCLSFGRRRSLLLILFLALFVRSLLDFVGDLPDELLLCPVRALRLYLSLLILALCLSLLALPRAFCLRMLLASFFGTSSLALTPLRPLRLLLVRLLLLLLPHLRLFVHTVFVGLLIPGPFLVTLLFLLFWRLPLGLPLWSLRLPTPGMISSPLLLVLVLW